MNLFERFKTYVEIETMSDESSTTAPSSMCQWDLARYLENELKEIGVPKVILDEFGIVYGWIPATKGLEDKMALGLIAHMDTSPAASGKNVKLQLIPNYDGNDVHLNDEVSLLVKDFPHLKNLAGRTLVTTDGTTLMGADDKAGIAEIVTVVEKIISENIPHGPLCIAFTPDEEVGHGTDNFNVELFGADVAYTADGGPENEISCETFNAASAHVIVHGYSVHPGSSKDVMINAALVACEFNQMLPNFDTPRNTEGYQGFFHLHTMKGDVTEAQLFYIIRDHDRTIYEYRKQMMERIATELNTKYGEGVVEVIVKDSYNNMKEIIDQHPHLMENACAAIREAGMEPYIEPVRGGTDGARLSFEGLPCPNLGTGGYAYHGLREHITIEGMELACKVLLGIVGKYAQ